MMKAINEASHIVLAKMAKESNIFMADMSS
jgi:hypothetical protein